MGKLIHYLLVYDHAADALIEERAFSDAGRALSAYRDAEDEHNDNNQTEIVLVASDSLETIQQTHANYFKRAPRSHFFEGILR